ncbi:MAG: hypothetical protein MJ192_08190 [Clostridia bacterium]|nr:hypothetical protein [Clostridia bacterium]
MNRRMDKTRLNIGTYYLRAYARTEQHVRDLRDCGIDFVVSMDSADRATLDLFEKYGVGCVVNDVLPGWWGGNGEKSGSLDKVNTMDKYEAGAASFKDHPAIWGVDIGDEPSALDFPYYGRVYSKVNAMFPNQFVYLNLYPNYASVSQNDADETICQLGTKTYEEHIERYCREVPSDYISYDFYVYQCNLPKMYDNFRIVADACRKTGRAFWYIPQVNSYNPAVWVSENELRFQAYTAMAFGAEVITWACYTAGWWNNQVLDDKGEKTEQYEKLKAVNAELHTLSESYMKYRSTATHLVGFGGTGWLNGVGQASEDEVNTGVFRGVKAVDGQALAVGEMTGRADPSAKALFLAAADDPYDQHPAERAVTFTVDPDVTVEAFGGKGRVPVDRGADGVCTVMLPPSGGVLVTAV